MFAQVSRGGAPLLALALALCLSPVRAAVIYVSQSATGAGNGSSWEDAFVHLQDALAEAAASPDPLNEILVAAGTYAPDQGAQQTPGDRNATFQLVSGVTIYGGFSDEARSFDRRDPWGNVTILSGDLNADDRIRNNTDCCEERAEPGCESTACQTAVCEWDSFCCDDHWDSACVDRAGYSCGLCCESRCNRSDNSFQVVNGSGTDSSAVLDGCVVKGGTLGGGLFIRQGSPVIRNLVFEDNIGSQGAGMFVEDGSPTVMNSIFSNNEVDSGFATGGAVYLGLRTGGISQHVIFFNCLFHQNHALREAGALHRSPAYGELSVELNNCTVAFNSTDGEVGGVLGAQAMRNTILWGNTDTAGADESAQLDVFGGVDHSCVQGWTGKLGGVGNFGKDPQFVSGPLGSYYLAHDAAGQATESPGVDAGGNTAVSLGLDSVTTRTDECPDVTTADIGYHYPIRAPLVPGDFDRNGAVELPDVAAFQNCFSGAGSSAVDPCCRVLDVDRDEDVDLFDYHALYEGYVSP